MTELYPQLKEHCLQHNCELQIYDMHWCMDDMPFDNHSYVQNCMQAVEECQQTRAINFVVGKNINCEREFFSIYHIFYFSKISFAVFTSSNVKIHLCSTDFVSPNWNKSCEGN